MLEPLSPFVLCLLCLLHAHMASRCTGADHIPEIFAFPVSDVPIPYTELLITANPGYKKGGKSPEGARPGSAHAQHLCLGLVICSMLSCRHMCSVTEQARSMGMSARPGSAHAQQPALAYGSCDVQHAIVQTHAQCH
jgi:hypothetical protein